MWDEVGRSGVTGDSITNGSSNTLMRKYHTLRELIKDAGEGLSTQPSEKDVLDAPIIISCSQGVEAELLSFFFSKGKLYIDIEAR